MNSVPYRLIRSNRKTLALEITGSGEVVVRAPIRCPKDSIERFVSEKQEWVHAHLAKVEAHIAAHPEPTDAERLAYICCAKQLIPTLVEKYARLMNLSPTGIKITGAQKRFGSCSGRNSLCFSWRLMQYPYEAIEYVVVHELAHIVHKDHSPAFHALVAKYLPDHVERRKLLKK